MPYRGSQEFIKELGYEKVENTTDEFLKYCNSFPTYEEVVTKYPSEVFEYELQGKIKVEDGVVKPT